MQKVVWPTTIVHSDSEMPPKLKNEFNASPVTIPGSASGSTNMRLTTSLPNHVIRLMANAAHEPRISARAVAVRPAWRESPSEERTSGSFQVEVNHLRVRPGMGQLSMFEVLNAYTKISAIGMKRNRRSSATHIQRTTRVARLSIREPRRRPVVGRSGGTRP